MPSAPNSFDPARFINPSQVAGVDRYVIDDGAGRGVRALCVNTGGGLRYRVLVDRGLDVDQAFFHQHSLAFLSHGGVTRPTRALDRGMDWLKGFPGGLLTSCGPFNTGAPAADAGEELGLHGTHSNTPAELVAVEQPQLQGGDGGGEAVSITGVVRYGGFYGPNVELRRTIRSTVGANQIEITDTFRNAGNADAPHAWLLHINFGYPLLDEGAELCFDSPTLDARPDPASQKRFGRRGYKRAPGPLAEHVTAGNAFAYLAPRPRGRDGRVTVGIVNRRLGLGVAVRYGARDFPRCGNWQHFSPGEYVTALEPMNGGVEGRDKDRERGWLDALPAGGTKTYRYELEVVTDRAGLAALLDLNRAKR